MLSRVVYLMRYNCPTKFAAPVIYPKIVVHRSVVNKFIKCQSMSTVPDDVFNEPSRNLDYNQLLEKKKDPKTVLIDVREPSEINETGKLPGSIHIPLNEVEKIFQDMTPEDFHNVYKAPKPDCDTQIIFPCRSGKRSMTALKTALKLGYKNAAHYKGGWLDWAENTKSSQN